MATCGWIPMQDTVFTVNWKLFHMLAGESLRSTGCHCGNLLYQTVLFSVLKVHVTMVLDFLTTTLMPVFNWMLQWGLRAWRKQTARFQLWVLARKWTVWSSHWSAGALKKHMSPEVLFFYPPELLCELTASDAVTLQQFHSVTGTLAFLSPVEGNILSWAFIKASLWIFG